MQSLQSRSKINTHQNKKGRHFNFNADEQIDTQGSNLEYPLKRSKPLIYEQNIEQINHHRYNQHHKTFQFDSRQFNEKIAIQNEEQRNLKPIQINNEENLKKEKQELEQMSIELLKDFLLHSQKANTKLFNTSIANQWIIDNNKPNKIRSFLMLYMIIHHFDKIQFKFIKKIRNSNNTFQKTILIEKRIQIGCTSNEENQQKYKDNLRKRYFIEYVEWLIWVNENFFAKDSQNTDFSALALNNCEKVSLELFNGNKTNQRYWRQNIYKGLFLCNAEDLIFRDTTDTTSDHKNIISIKRQDLLSLPKCHWLLALNLRLKYFYKTQFEQKMKKSLAQINPRQTKDFFIELLLFTNRYSPEQTALLNFQQNIDDLPSYIFTWITMQQSIKDHREDKNFIEKIYKLNKNISKSLLQRAIGQKMNMQQSIQMISLLLDQDTLSQSKLKGKILSDLLYTQDKMILKCQSQFNKTILNLEQSSKGAFYYDTIKTLSEQYTQNYKHKILSEKCRSNNDFLSQAKNLLRISQKYRDSDMRKRMKQILSDTKLVAHWNINIVRATIFIGEQYLSSGEDSKENEELELLLQIVKVASGLAPMGFILLDRAATWLAKFNPLTSASILNDNKLFGFIKGKLLTILFESKHNQALEILKNNINQQQSESLNHQNPNLCFEKLEKIAEGYPIHSTKLKLLKLSRK